MPQNLNTPIPNPPTNYQTGIQEWETSSWQETRIQKPVAPGICYAMLMCSSKHLQFWGGFLYMWMITERYSGGKPEFAGIPYLNPIRFIVNNIIDHAMAMSQAELFKGEDDFSIWLRTQGLFRSSLHHWWTVETVLQNIFVPLSLHGGSFST